MDSVNKTLYIPLYGKAYVSRRGIILKDTKAEEIWAAEGFSLKGKARSKWLAYEMGMRSAVMDRWLTEKMAEYPKAAVLHIGCGMDSRVLRIGGGNAAWFDLDFPEVIRERQRYYSETENYRMVGCDLRDPCWVEALPRGGTAIAVMEGVSMYLQPEELKAFLRQLTQRFDLVYLLMDNYTVFAAKATRYKNPINTVGVTRVYGFDDPEVMAQDTGMGCTGEHPLTPEDLISQLPGFEAAVFRKVFAGKMAHKIYRLYSYEKLK